MEHVDLKDGFLKKKQDLNAEKTVHAVYDRSKETGRIDAFKLEWKKGETPTPHKFWDSDVAKWVEAAAYSLYHHEDPDIRKKLDETIKLIESAQIGRAHV